MIKSERLREEANAVLAKAKAIAQAADDAGRDFTADEKADYTKYFEQAKDLNEQRKAAQADEKVLVDAKALADELGMGPAGGDDVSAQGREPERKAARQSLGATVVRSPEFKALMAPYKGRMPDKVRVQSDPINFDTLIGRKSLFVGGSDTSAGAFVVNERTDIVSMLGRRALTIRDLVSVRQTGSDTVEYLEQTSHTNAAAVVAEATSSARPTVPATPTGLPLTQDANGGYKPEGAWAFAIRATNVKTIAEWVPATKRSLADVAQLEGLINDELVTDLEEKEEDQILNGSGSGENITGILATSGIQTQAKTAGAEANKLFDAFRKALTKARTTGRVNPTAIVLNPADAERIDLAVDANLRYFGAGPFSAGPRTLWGVPIVESEAQPANTGLVGDFKKAVLWDREQASVTMTDSHEDYFVRNLVAILAEERVAFAVTRPLAFVTVTGLNA